MPAEEPARESAAERDDGADASRIREIERRLRQRYEEPDKRRRPPLDELLLTILSQNTNDTNRDRAWEELRFALHLLLIRHGRATCGARQPACGECALVDLCPRVGVA